jgi:hypothetical protein
MFVYRPVMSSSDLLPSEIQSQVDATTKWMEVLRANHPNGPQMTLEQVRAFLRDEMAKRVPPKGSGGTS